MNKISQIPARIINFLKEVRAELERVTWPTRQEAIKHTVTIVLFTLIVAMLLGGLDSAFLWLLNRFIL